jgi:8-oxo-dGTP pyrophosphatase MutT (NUDIX family)
MASTAKTLAAPNMRVFRPSQLRKMKGTEQVAAVCFRVQNRRIEFLLVQTGGGRWTFPKGSAEPGLTRAQAAALEAFEEAGVHGRMEETSFARYTLPREGIKRSNSPRSNSSQNLVVHAHLCEVSRLEAPQEDGRNPTWFSPEKSIRRLR